MYLANVIAGRGIWILRLPLNEADASGSSYLCSYEQKDSHQRCDACGSMLREHTRKTFPIYTLQSKILNLSWNVAVWLADLFMRRHSNGLLI